MTEAEIQGAGPEAEQATVRMHHWTKAGGPVITLEKRFYHQGTCFRHAIG